MLLLAQDSIPLALTRLILGWPAARSSLTIMHLRLDWLHLLSRAKGDQEQSHCV